MFFQKILYAVYRTDFFVGREQKLYRIFGHNAVFYIGERGKHAAAQALLVVFDAAPEKLSVFFVHLPRIGRPQRNLADGHNVQVGDNPYAALVAFALYRRHKVRPYARFYAAVGSIETRQIRNSFFFKPLLKGDTFFKLAFSAAFGREGRIRS